MCGIVGGIWTRPRGDEAQRLTAALHQLRHRGPDDEGMEFFRPGNGLVGLGHTRLSILDLSPAGHQPMTSVSGRNVIVYNGEIYNFQELREELEEYGYEFRSSCDTEVLLTAWEHWGEGVLPRLEGMFAFAIYDKKRKEVFLARDEFGIKPLYISHDGDDFFFSSELPSILTIRNRRNVADVQQLYDYVVHWYYGAGDRTFVKDIKVLRAGWMARVGLRGGISISLSKWSDLEKVRASHKSLEEAEEEVREEFLRSVRLHLRSDVPVGVALSGGIDSSAIACAVRKVEPDARLVTFTFDAGTPDLSEKKWAEEVIRQVRPEAVFVRKKGRDLLDDVDDLIKAQGEPFNGLSIYAQFSVFRAAHEHGIKVLLEGQGGDEILAGYDPYVGTRLLALWRARDFRRMGNLLSGWTQRRGHRAWLQLCAHAFRSSAPDFLYGFARTVSGAGHAPSWLNVDWFRERGTILREPRYILRKDVEPEQALCDHLVTNLVHRNLPSALLRRGDRNAMFHSMENRVPFLTPRLARLLLSLPAELLVSPEGETKFILRRAMRGILPEKIVNRKDKIGFDPPEKMWISMNKDMILGAIVGSQNGRFVVKDFFNRNFDKFINKNNYFVGYNSRTVWRIFNVIEWMNIFDICLE